MRKLRCVWVSHMHADHHGGLYPLMVLRQELLGPSATPLLVIGPLPLLRTLRMYSQVVSRPVSCLRFWERTLPCNSVRSGLSL